MFSNKPLLEVKNLTIQLKQKNTSVPIVQDINLKLEAGKILGLVGESGCGKSMTALALMRLLPQDINITPESKILFQNHDLVQLSTKTMANYRGSSLSMIFQDPMTALNPLQTIGEQVSEVLRVHKGFDAKTAQKQAIEMLTKVGIPAAAKRYHEYPHQLSGGMRQRVLISMALICKPRLLIADEPTTALDVTIQAQILRLIRQLNQELGTAIILITHDMGVVASLADEVAVMYAGRIVEQGDVNAIFSQPQHPYTTLLLKSIPRLDTETKELASIKGIVPDIFHMPTGCRFASRCPFASQLCKQEEPLLLQNKHTLARCWRREKNDE